VKVTFVYPDLNLGKFNLGIGYLSAALKRGNHVTELIHLKEHIGRDEFISRLKQSNPDLVAISSCTNMMPYSRELAFWAKQASDKIPVICGGVHSTLCPEESISFDSFDMICLGEGEEALLELCDRLEKAADITAIKNLWIKQGGRIYRNEIRPLISNLDSLPFADRSIFSSESLIEDDKLGATFVMVSRGCPYSCSYCSNQAFHGLYRGKGSYLRFRSVGNIIQELEFLKNSYNTIIFHDDILPLNQEWLKVFTKEYKTKIGLPFICNLRVELAQKDALELLKDAGCIQVCLGVESGNDFIRKEIMHRNMSREQIVRAFHTCRQLGIQTKSFNMVGLPFEDMGKVLETIKLNVEANPDIIQVSIFYPYPGTELFEISRKNNFITDKNLVSYFDGSVLSLPTMNQSQIYFARKRFVKMFKRYKAYKKLPYFIAKFMENITDAIFKSRLMAKHYVVQRNFSQYLKVKRRKNKRNIKP